MKYLIIIFLSSILFFSDQSTIIGFRIFDDDSGQQQIEFINRSNLTKTEAIERLLDELRIFAQKGRL